MNKFDFTKGNWKISKRYSNDVVDKDGFEIAEVHITQINCNTPINEHWATNPKYYKEIKLKEVWANARLISCAPELLESLIEKVNQDIELHSQLMTIEISEKFYKEKKIKENILLIEKSTGKKWSEINGK